MTHPDPVELIPEIQDGFNIKKINQWKPYINRLMKKITRSYKFMQKNHLTKLNTRLGRTPRIDSHKGDFLALIKNSYGNLHLLYLTVKT